MRTCASVRLLSPTAGRVDCFSWPSYAAHSHRPRERFDVGGEELRRYDAVQVLAEALRHGGELDLGARHVAQQLVRRRLLAEPPQLAQERARLAPREPLAAEALAQV